ncbi:MAG TPA: hypothetical protein VK864_19095, partial [Longimicrobiales bacterium]|nr:hypothetical protein [Longimicrobiales bacterium]
YLAARRDWRGVLREVARIGGQADLATLALAGDAAFQLGDSARGAAYYDQVERSARAQPEPFARQWTQFCLEHRRHPAETLAVLEREISERPDVMGYQLLAWAYLNAGDPARANAAISSALRLGTRDGLLHYLAGEARLAAGDAKAARRHFATALAINPNFHHIRSDSARTQLRRLAIWPAE